MRVQTFDDGSTITYNDDGSVAAATDYYGVNVPVSSPSPIVGQFSDLFNNGVSRLFSNLNWRINTAIPTESEKTRAAQQAQLQKLLVLGGLGLVAFTLLKG